MATVTIRKLPDELVERVRAAAAANGRSLEQELREALAARYPARADVCAAVRGSWGDLPAVEPEEIDAWVETGRG